MKINLDDPNLTAYALGELSHDESAAIAKSVASNAEAQAFIEETQQLARLLQNDFRAELGQSGKPLNIMPFAQPRSFWSDARWLSIGVAALLAVGALVAAVILSGRSGTRVAVTGSYVRPSPSESEVQMEFDLQPTPPSAPPTVALKSFELAGLGEAIPSPSPQLRYAAKRDLRLSTGEQYTAGIVYGDRLAGASQSMHAAEVASRSRAYQGNSDLKAPAPADSFNTAEYDHFDENPFLLAASNPLSTFSIDVDTASYANVRRMINAETKPPKDAVRIEEMINYFSYDYPQPDGKQPFSINLEVAGCPWTPDHRLVRIGLKGREIASDKRGASNLVFLLDVSSSMEPSNRLPLVKQAMRLLVDKLTENDRVAIVVYAGNSGLVLPSTTGDRKEEILRALEELRAGGSTNGAAGINIAYEIAAEHFIKGGVNRVILATDGDFNVGVTSQGDLVRLAEEKAKGGVFLTVLGVGDDNLKDSTMVKLADKANGNYAYLDSLDEARKVLVRQMNGTLITIAKDVKVQVEFNPLHVASYRLLGYEKRMLRKEDFNNDKIDAGEIGAGHTVTALYEVVPRGAAHDPAASAPPVDALKYGGPDVRAVASTYPSPDLLTVKLRYKQPEGDKSELIERPLVDTGLAFRQASPDFQFAAAVAEFGMILRDSPHKGSATLTAVLDCAREAKGRDESGYRTGFIELARKAQALAF